MQTFYLTAVCHTALAPSNLATATADFTTDPASMARFGMIVSRYGTRSSPVPTHVLVKVMRSTDWICRHLFLSVIRCAYHNRVVSRIENLMGPDELLYGQNKSRTVSESIAIPLHDISRQRQTTLHKFFKLTKKTVTKKKMRQLTLHQFFKRVL